MCFCVYMYVCVCCIVDDFYSNKRQRLIIVVSNCITMTDKQLNIQHRTYKQVKMIHVLTNNIQSMNSAENQPPIHHLPDTSEKKKVEQAQNLWHSSTIHYDHDSLGYIKMSQLLVLMPTIILLMTVQNLHKILIFCLYHYYFHI